MYIYIYTHVYIPTCRSVGLPCRPIDLSINIPICPSICLSILSDGRTVCLVYLSTYLPLLLDSWLPNDLSTSCLPSYYPQICHSSTCLYTYLRIYLPDMRLYTHTIRPVYVCIYFYIHKQTNIHTYRQTASRPARQTHRQACIHTYLHPYLHTCLLTYLLRSWGLRCYFEHDLHVCQHMYACERHLCKWPQRLQLPITVCPGSWMCTSILPQCAQV